ncbi:phage head-tail connector protein [Atopobium fossor]|uniref:phage head-tail connector protein n=1 Tax=Atopobium fossor TaxID=39487 RepID=UPI000422720C|nr:phage gp6-like head-tail connector protein [Atopobium fossor]
MALLDEVRSAVRVSDGYYDPELKTLIDAALFDMQNKGVLKEFIGDDENSYPAIVKQAIVLFAKANFGLDNDEADRFMRTYNVIVCSLLNGTGGIAGVGK